MELQLFDLEQYTAPPAQISEDGDDDYENPQYIPPYPYGRDGGKTKVLRFLHTKTMGGSAAICHIAFKTGLPEPRIQGLAATDGHLFETELLRELWLLKLTENGKKVAKLVVENLPNDAELLNERLGHKYIELKWAAYGGMQSQVFKLTKEKRNYGTGWASLENRLSRGKYEQWFLHYQLPKEPKRSKYVSGKQLAKVREMIAAKKPIPEILEVIGSKKKGL